MPNTHCRRDSTQQLSRVGGVHWALRIDVLVRRRRIAGAALLLLSIKHCLAGPSRATAGPGKPFSRGPITTVFLCAEIETPKASRGKKKKRGEGVPSPSDYRVCGSVVIQLPSLFCGASTEN